MASSEVTSLVDLADLVEHLSEGLQVVDRDFRYLYLNRVAAAHGQRSAEELVGRTMMECYPGIETTPFFGRLERVLADGIAQHMENRFTFPNGSVGWFELRMTRVPHGAMILSVDITDRKRLEALARRGERIEAVGELAGGVSHDFNNFLTIITAYGTMAAQSLSDDHPARADVACILEAARRGADLTRKLLTFAKQAPSVVHNVSVHHALTEFSEILRRAVPPNITLTLAVPEEVGSIRMDPTALDQIVMNLVVNARDAIGTKRGNIAIEAERMTLLGADVPERGTRLQAGEYVRVSVRDDGAGIPSAIIDRIFDPFFTTKAPEVGTGLGLATCWGLVERAGGAITVSSEPGVGTTFRVYLPRIEGPAEVDPMGLR